MTIDQKVFSRIESAVLIFVVLLYGWATYERNFVWKDEFSLWSDVVKKSLNKARPHNQLGVALTGDGKYDEAIAEITHAISINPDPKRYVALGNAYREKGLLDLALAQYFKALSLKPDFFEVYVNIGNVYVRKGLIDQAIVYYKKGISLKPGYVTAYVDLASAYGLKGYTKEAIAEYKIALELESDNPDIHYNLGLAYEQLAKSYELRTMSYEQKDLINKAINEYKKTLMLNPDDLQARERMTKLMSH